MKQLENGTDLENVFLLKSWIIFRKNLCSRTDGKWNKAFFIS